MGAPSPAMHRVVIIDDNKDAADSLAQLLHQMDIDAYVAYDGAAGLTLIRGCRPKLVFLDLAMPGMSGFDVVRAVRQLPDLSDTHIVALTAFGQPGNVSATLGEGFDGHLVKPVSLEVLAEAIARYCDEPTPGEVLSPLVSL